MVALYVLAFLSNGQDILLLRRHNTTFGNGLYSMPGGKVEAGETATQAIAREVKEELGLTIPVSDFKLVHVIHRYGSEGAPLVALCFSVDSAHMSTPRNMEPEKHDDLRFFNPNQLPENTFPAHKQIIACIKEGIGYSEHGWHN